MPFGCLKSSASFHPLLALKKWFFGRVFIFFESRKTTFSKLRRRRGGRGAPFLLPGYMLKKKRGNMSKYSSWHLTLDSKNFTKFFALVKHFWFSTKIFLQHLSLSAPLGSWHSLPQYYRTFHYEHNPCPIIHFAPFQKTTPRKNLYGFQIVAPSPTMGSKFEFN